VPSVHRHIMYVHQCNYFAQQKAVIDMHVKYVHDRIKDHLCPKCDYSTISEDNLDSHVQLVHESIRSYKCSHCDYDTTHMYHFTHHMYAKHEHVRDYTCTKCQYKSATAKTRNFPNTCLKIRSREKFTNLTAKGGKARKRGKSSGLINEVTFIYI
jgi:hypothetical protein